MYAQCPECLTVFSLDAETLAQARGEVTCGYCSGSFDALASLAGQLPPEPFERLPRQPVTGQVPRLELAVYRPPLEAVPELVDVVTMDALASIAPVAAVAAHADAVTPAPPDVAFSAKDAPNGRNERTAVSEGAEPVPLGPPDQPEPDAFVPLAFSPRFARGRSRAAAPRAPSRAPSRGRTPGIRRWPWLAVCALLVLALGAQLGWAERDALIRDPQVGGWLREACATLGCRLPLVRDVRRLQLVARDVRTRPGSNGALAISATVRNDAPFAQPWPVVTLTLADAHGKPVAMRRLRPGEYLSDRAVLRAGLAPGGTAALLFEVRDPGTAAASFQFAFE